VSKNPNFFPITHSRAMAFRQRAPTFRPQLSVRRFYETFQPRSEIKDLPEAYLLRVYLPGLQIFLFS